MMDRLLARGRAIAVRRTAELIDALVEATEAELPPGLAVERRDDGIAIAGRDLARRLAYDARLRGLTLLLKAMRR